MESIYHFLEKKNNNDVRLVNFSEHSGIMDATKHSGTSYKSCNGGRHQSKCFESDTAK